MKKIVGFLAFTVLITVSSVTFAEVTFANLSFAEALKQAKKENKLVMVDYYTTWCGWCKVLDKKTYSNKDVGEYANANMISLKVDAEKGEGVELVRRSSIQGYPTIIFYDGDGKEVSRVVGFVDAAPFIERMKMAVSAKPAN
jgi:thiol:disulfide interchange protein